jgi:hypothetical protein
MIAYTVQPVLQEAHVTAICTPHHVECIAQEGYRTHDPVERHISQHANEKITRNSELARLVHNIERHRGRNGVTNSRHKADEGIEPEPYVGAWDNKRGIQQSGERIYSS